jgi:hypothetical protein
MKIFVFRAVYTIMKFCINLIVQSIFPGIDQDLFQTIKNLAKSI